MSVTAMLFALALAGSPQEASSEAQKTEEAKPAETKVKLICRREAEPNTRFSRKVCRTPEQIAEMQDRNQDAVRKSFVSGATPPARR